jgi:hypothetical protein
MEGVEDRLDVERFQGTFLSERSWLVTDLY